MTCLRCGVAFIPGRPSMWCLRCRVDHQAGPTPPPGLCCEPSSPPSAAAYKRHRRKRTTPCEQSYTDAVAYRQTRPRYREAS